MALQGIPEVTSGDDLAGLLLESAGTLVDGDVVVVSSKVVSKAAALTAPLSARDSVVEDQTMRVVAERRTPRGLARVVESVSGPVLAAAGVDASNAGAATVLLLPRDPDGSARALRARLRSLGAPRIAVVITDTAGRAWRTGQTDFALGCAGLVVTDDLRGQPDASGITLEVTERAIADEVAAAADLVKGKVSGVPAALVRGLAHFVTEDDGPGASALLREPASDWFRFGHVEAVRASLGVHPGLVEAQSVTTETLQHKAQRALDLACTIGTDQADSFVAQVVATDSTVTIGLQAGDGFVAGLLTGRLMSALWSEDLTGTLKVDLDNSLVTVAVERTDR